MTAKSKPKMEENFANNCLKKACFGIGFYIVLNDIMQQKKNSVLFKIQIENLKMRLNHLFKFCSNFLKNFISLFFSQ